MATREIYIRKEDFIIDLGFELPNVSISEGADWHKLCEHRSLLDRINNVQYKFYDVIPENFSSYMQYTAAYQLCRYAAGIDKEDSLEDTFIVMALCKAVMNSTEDNPLRYYDCFHHKFLYLLALNTRSNWAGQFDKFSDLSDVFYELNKRSYVQVIDAFTWLYGFFYDLSCKVCPTNSHELSDSIMWLSPDVPIALDPLLSLCLTSDTWGVSNRHLVHLAKCAAGVYRMNKKEKATKIYTWCFETAFDSELSAECKREVVSVFMERLEYGYYGNVYDIDNELIALIKSHISKFKNKQWVTAHTNRLLKYKL